MPSLDLGWLQCPFCKGPLQAVDTYQADGATHGLLTCRCEVYPLVAGIPIIRKDHVTPAAHPLGELTALMKKGQHREALLRLLAPPSPRLAPDWVHRLPRLKGLRRLPRIAHRWTLRAWRERAKALVFDPHAQVTACDMLYFCGRGMDLNWRDTYHYFAYRFGQPRHLVALSLMSLIEDPPGPLLDLTSGFGHMTFSLLHRAQGQPVIGVEQGFLGAYIAQRWVAREAAFVCCDASVPLPFVTELFSAAQCVDGFHYIADKLPCMRELRRVVKRDGAIVLSVVRNALVPHPGAGLPLPPEGYRALVEDTPHGFVDDSDLLARYLRKEGPFLTRTIDLRRLANAPTVSLIVSTRRDVFADHGSLEHWPHAEGRLTLNPLYTHNGSDREGRVHLRRSFPSRGYEEDNADCKTYMPEEAVVRANVVDDLARGARTPEVERLADQFIALGMPNDYGADRIH